MEQSIFPSFEELLDSSFLVTLPLKVPFRSVKHREVMLLHGPAGWAEFSPFLEYAPDECASWLVSAIEAAWIGYPQPLRETIPINATLPAVPPKAIPAILEGFGPVSAVKIKVAQAGQSLHDDIERVKTVRRRYPEANLRIDANAAWTRDQAFKALSILAEYTLEYAEQPVRSVADMARLRHDLSQAQIPVLLAADESLRKEHDPLAVARAQAADILVVKAPPLGGVRRALQLVAKAGMPAVVSSALDSSVGIRTGLALAAALPELPYACGLATAELLRKDICPVPFLPQDGHLRLRSAVPDFELLQQNRAPMQRHRWWHSRLHDTYAALVASHKLPLPSTEPPPSPPPAGRTQ